MGTCPYRNEDQFGCHDQDGGHKHHLNNINKKEKDITGTANATALASILIMTALTHNSEEMMHSSSICECHKVT